MPETATATDNTLAELLASAVALSTDDQRQIVRTAQVLIEQLFVHLPLKRAMHAIDPVQRLRLLDHRLESLTERQFHDEMIAIFIGLRDMHTNYLMPAPFTDKRAVLPFRVQECFEDGARQYIVTAVTPDLVHEPFARGVEVTHWNGMPIDRAVALNGERNGGCNADARHARGLASLTQRPLKLLATPDEAWVDVTFLAAGAAHEQRFTWVVKTDPPPAPPPPPSPGLADPARDAIGLDLLVEDIRRAQKLEFAPEAIELERRMAADGDGPSPDELTTVSLLPDHLQFRTVPGPLGDLGYLRIRTFLVKGDQLELFATEVRRILALLPQDGLIIDVRGNGGGTIAAGERMLQLLTPRAIEPTHLHFINTPLTLEASTTAGYVPWHESIAEAVETGAPFSDGLPLSPGYPASCNAIGQLYHGPVVLVTDALCYSTTDIFAAGFQDHEIGKVIGIDRTTGAGGANVWDYKGLLATLPGHFDALPGGAEMRVAIRRTTRVGARAGDPIEDLGVASDRVHRMTRRDLLEDNVDLISEAAGVLAAMPRRVLSVEATARPGAIDLAVRSMGLDRLDVAIDGRPQETRDVTDGAHALTVVPVGAGAHTVELRGFSAGRLAAARKLAVTTT